MVDASHRPIKLSGHDDDGTAIQVMILGATAEARVGGGRVGL
jgi:hypothetical protein